jgi:alpha-N-arabinofuranosidase
VGRIKIRGAEIQSAEGRVLVADDIHAHNSFQDLHAVESREAQVGKGGPILTHEFPPASVTRLDLRLA